jgi:TorA-specific chaperone
MSCHATPAAPPSADALRWLAGLFAAPLPAEAVSSLRVGPGAVQLALLAQIPELAEGAERMRCGLAALPDGAAGAAVLAQCHTLLFSGAGGPDTVPPYESAFTSASGRLFGAAEGRFRRLLAELNLRVAAGPAEPADHVAVELATLAELLAAPHPAADGPCLAVAAVLQGWLGRFAAACAARDRSGFYAGAATVAAALVGLDPLAALSSGTDPHGGKT